jgi:protein EFR3
MTKWDEELIDGRNYGQIVSISLPFLIPFSLKKIFSLTTSSLLVSFA